MRTAPLTYAPGHGQTVDGVKAPIRQLSDSEYREMNVATFEDSRRLIQSSYESGDVTYFELPVRGHMKW